MIRRSILEAGFAALGLAWLAAACAPAPAPRPAAPPVAMSSAASAPRDPGVLGFDAHVHLFSPSGGDDLSLDAVRPALRAGSFAGGAVISAGYHKRELAQVRRESDFVAEQIKPYRSRFVGFCGVHPRDGWALGEVERCARELHLGGLKLHEYEQGLNPNETADRDAIDALIAKAEELDLVVLVHTERAARAFQSIAQRHPRLRIVFAHAYMCEFRALLGWIRSYEAQRRWPSRKEPSAYVDLSGIVPLYRDSPERDVILWHLRKFGMDRVLFGSDYPLSEPRDVRAMLLDFGFHQDELTKILRDNALKLFPGLDLSQPL